MIWINRHSKKFFIAGTALVAFIFTLPYFWPVDREWYFRNLSWMIPLAIVVFIAPIVPFILTNWDIHFSFQVQGDSLIAIISNYGNNQYGFNRIQFASGKKYRIFGKREFYPQIGLSDENIEYHGADTPSRILHPHIGCTLRRGLPITLTIRQHKAPENLRNLTENKKRAKKVYLSLYYEGTKQRVYSQPIPPKIVMEIIQNYKQA